MPERRYATIVCLDVVGSSRMMEIDEGAALSAIRSLLADVVGPAAARHRGRIVKTTGDGAMLEFASPVEAVTCSVEIQRTAVSRAVEQAEDARVLLRIGVNLGDIVVGEDGDLYGDDVNIAARLETLADPGGLCISAKVHEELKGKLAIAFEDRGEHALKNIGRPIRIYATDAFDAPAPRIALALPDKPSIAVLPFRNLDDDLEHDYFTDGVVEDILTALGRLKWLFVSARSSTFSYKGHLIDPKRVGSELGVRYLLQGSVRRAGSRLRLTSRLVEAETGDQIWADRYEGALEDVFELQDQITANVAGAIEPRLRHAEIERARRKAPEHLSSYDCFLRALALMYESTPASLEAAMTLLDATIARDPGYAQPYALAAWICMYRTAQGWVSEGADDAARGVAYARAAIEREREDSTALWMAASAFGVLARDVEMARLLLSKAIQLNPNCAPAFWMNGWALCFVGQPREAIADLRTAIRLSPVDRTTVAAASGLALAFCMDGQFEESVAWARKAISDQGSWTASYRPLAASLAQLGQEDEARRVAERLLELDPHYRMSRVRALYRPGASTDRYFDGLRMAGLPE